MQDEKRTPDALEGMMRPVEIKAWIAVGTILLVLAVVLIWGFFGTMQLREDVAGVLVRSGKTLDLYAQANGAVLDVAIQTGAYVVEDQVIVRLEQLDLVARINALAGQDAPEAEIDALRQELIRQSQVQTFDAGRVTDVYVQTGDIVKAGDKLATILVGASADHGLECLLYATIDQIKGIERGQLVNVYPAGVNRKTYGNMIGTVTGISEYPVTERDLRSRLGSEALASTFLGGTAHYEVSLVLDVSGETETGFRWTTSEGPVKPFGDLTLVDATVIVDELRPIDVFFLAK